MHALAERGIAREACEAYLANGDSARKSRAVSDALPRRPGKGGGGGRGRLYPQNREYLTKKSVGPSAETAGPRYGSRRGGSVLASGRDINILVLDTEVYSNTGGWPPRQRRPAPYLNSFAGGKETKKKDLGRMAMSYGYVYVAQVAMGADPAQTLRAIREAEAYNGPSLIICYCPH